MEIIWLGQSCFKIQDKNIILITDPYNCELGLKPLQQLKADIVTVSHNHGDHNNIGVISGIDKKTPPLIISDPGEYEIKNVFIYGISCFHDKEQGKQRGLNTIYLIKINEITVAHLGDLGHILSDEQLEKIEKVDILLIPVGGTVTINAKEAKQIISQIEPKIVIPMHYQIPGLEKTLDGVDKFYSEMSIKKPEIISKLKISRKDLISQIEMKIIEMENKH